MLLRVERLDSFAIASAIFGHKEVSDEGQGQGSEPLSSRYDCWIGHKRNQTSALAVANTCFLTLNGPPQRTPVLERIRCVVGF
jgi:hypothetical protein